MTLPDPNNVGQAAVAVVQYVNAQRDMDKLHDDAHRGPPTNALWRASKMRLYMQAQKKHDEAKAVLDDLGMPEDKRRIWWKGLGE